MATAKLSQMVWMNSDNHCSVRLLLSKETIMYNQQINNSNDNTVMVKDDNGGFVICSITELNRIR